MMTETFIDTSGFYALLIGADDQHAAAAAFMRTAARDRRPLVTTDYVLDETATLLTARGRRHLSGILFEIILESEACRIEWMNPERFASVVSFFTKRVDQKWSFTDCFSFVLMNELHIEQALTKDAHFRAAGFTPLLV